MLAAGIEPARCFHQQILSLPCLPNSNTPANTGDSPWSWWAVSNPRPETYKVPALPTELHQHRSGKRLPQNCGLYPLVNTAIRQYFKRKTLRTRCWSKAGIPLNGRKKIADILPINAFFPQRLLVQRMGIEPTTALSGHQHLKLACLPNSSTSANIAAGSSPAAGLWPHKFHRHVHFSFRDS